MLCLVQSWGSGWDELLSEGSVSLLGPLKMQLKGGRIKVAGYRRAHAPVSSHTSYPFTYKSVCMTIRAQKPPWFLGEQFLTAHNTSLQTFPIYIPVKKSKCVVKQTKVHANASHQKAAVSLHWECNEDEA